KVIGRCPLEKYQPRCPLSSRLAQEFRILQQVNDFRIRAPEGDQTLSTEQRNAVIAALNREKEVTFDKLRKLLKLPAEARFNLEYEGREELTGNQIDHALDGIFKAAKRGRPSRWELFDEQTRDTIWQAVLGDDDALRARAQRDWGLDE